MNNRTTFTTELLTCPACRKPVEATFSAVVEVGYEPLKNPQALDSEVTVDGMMISHDCTPKAARVAREFPVLNKAVTGD